MNDFTAIRADLLAAYALLEPRIESGEMTQAEADQMILTTALRVHRPGSPEHMQAEKDWLPHRQRWYKRTSPGRRTAPRSPASRPAAGNRPRAPRRPGRRRAVRTAQDPGDSSGGDPPGEPVSPGSGPVEARVRELADPASWPLSDGQRDRLANLLGGGR